MIQLCSGYNVWQKKKKIIPLDQELKKKKFNRPQKNARCEKENTGQFLSLKIKGKVAGLPNFVVFPPMWTIGSTLSPRGWTQFEEDL